MGCIRCNLQDLAALATIVQAIVVGVALFYAWHQLREATRSRELSATTQLFTEIGAPHIRKARRFVLYDYKTSQPFQYKTLNTDQIDMLTSVAAAYDRVGYMILEELMPRKAGKALLDFHGDIELLWERIGPLVKYYRNDAEPRRPNYCKSFERLATDWVPKVKRKYGDKKGPGGGAGRERENDDQQGKR